MTKPKGIKSMSPVGLLLAVLPLAGCMATVGVANVSIPTDAAQICAGHCQSIGMQLSAVAIMAENVGCICQFGSAPRASAGAGAAGELGSPAAGMSTIVLQQAVMAAAAVQQQQRLQRQTQQQQPRRY